MKQVVLLLLFVFIGVQGDCGPWIPLDITTFPQALPNDTIFIRYLVAPLMECQYNNDGKVVSSYHGGISLVNQRSGFTITVNYDASPSFVLAIVPNIVKSNGTTELIWENFGKVFVYSGENDTYWETAVHIGNISGNGYNQFMKWLYTANDSYPYYNLWSVWTDYPGKVLLPNFECFAFV